MVLDRPEPEESLVAVILTSSIVLVLHIEEPDIVTLASDTDCASSEDARPFCHRNGIVVTAVISEAVKCFNCVRKRHYAYECNTPHASLPKKQLTPPAPSKATGAAAPNKFWCMHHTHPRSQHRADTLPSTFLSFLISLHSIDLLHFVRPVSKDVSTLSC